MTHTRSHRLSPMRHQAHRGMALIFALLALLALSLGAVTLLHSVDSGTRVLGNLGFKQEVTNATDRATQSAISWISSHSDSNTNLSLQMAALDANDPTNGYYATANGEATASSTIQVDPIGQRSTSTGISRRLIKWSGSSDTCSYASNVVTGECTLSAREVVTANGGTEPVTLRYAIFRLCSQALAPLATGNTCSQPVTSAGGTSNDRGELNYAKPSPLTGISNSVFYRIVVQATDARNTTTVTETIVQY